MRKNVYVFLTLILTLALFESKHVLYAQVIETPEYSSENTINPNDLLLSEKIPGIQEQVDLQVKPEKPKPGQEVEVTVNMYSLNINTVPILWKINGKEYQKGTGLKKIKFNIGESGQNTNLTVVIFLKSGNTIERSLTFNPIDIDLLWEAKTYTPPFYKGKALYTPESEVLFTSIPNMFADGKKIDPKDVVYNWYVDYELDNNNSGFNKNSYTFKGPLILRDVLVQNKSYSTLDQTIQGSGQIRLTHVKPQVNFYEDNPILGVLFNKAIVGEYTINNTEFKLSAFPFFFSTKNKNLTVTYNWEMDSNKLNLPAYQNSTIFRKVNNSKGSALAKLVINNPSFILQQATSLLLLRYEK